MSRASILAFALFGLALSRSAFAQDALAQKGEKVFADQKCAMCHSIAGKGNAKGSLDKVGDLCRVQAAQALERHEQLRRRYVTDERLHILPVEDRVAAQVGPSTTRDEPPQHCARAAIHPQ